VANPGDYDAVVLGSGEAGKILAEDGGPKPPAGSTGAHSNPSGNVPVRHRGKPQNKKLRACRFKSLWR